jgi:hypothetical protein
MGFYKRRLRISRFPWRDRSPKYTSSAAPTPWLSQPALKTDCLAQSTARPTPRHLGRWAVLTLGSEGFEQQIHELFETLELFGRFPAARRVVFNIGNAQSIYDVAAHHGALCIPVQPLAGVTPAIKALLYSSAQYINVDFYACFDSDCYIVQPLDQLTAPVERRPDKLFAVRAAQTQPPRTFHSFELTARTYYNASAADVRRLNQNQSVPQFLHLNAGMFAASRQKMLDLHQTIEAMQPAALEWINTRKSRAADELIFSLAIAKMRSLSELDKVFNLQLYADDTQAELIDHEIVFHHGSDRAKILHFAAPEGRAKYPRYRKLLSIS